MIDHPSQCHVLYACMQIVMFVQGIEQRDLCVSELQDSLLCTEVGNHHGYLLDGPRTMCHFTREPWG